MTIYARILSAIIFILTVSKSSKKNILCCALFQFEHCIAFMHMNLEIVRRILLMKNENAQWILLFEIEKVQLKLGTKRDSVETQRDDRCEQADLRSDGQHTAGRGQRFQELFSLPSSFPPRLAKNELYFHNKREESFFFLLPKNMQLTSANSSKTNKNKRGRGYCWLKGVSVLSVAGVKARGFLFRFQRCKFSLSIDTSLPPFIWQNKKSS